MVVSRLDEIKLLSVLASQLQAGTKIISLVEKLKYELLLNITVFLVWSKFTILCHILMECWRGKATPVKIGMLNFIRFALIIEKQLVPLYYHHFKTKII